MNEDSDPSLHQAASSSRPSSSTQLRPLRTSSSSSSQVEESDGENGLEMKKKDPLPPISGAVPDNIPSGTSRSSETSAGQKPRILSYRRESATDNESIKSTGSHCSLPASANSSGEVLVAQSVECQTEWSWLDDMRKLQQMKTATPPASRASKSAAVADDEWDLGTEGGTTGAAASSQATPSQLVSESISEAEGEDMALGDTYPPVDDAFGIPILHLDSDSGSSDEDSLYMYQCDSSQPGLDKQGTLASVGPPEILKYQKESTHPELESRASPETPAGGLVPLDAARLGTPHLMPEADVSDGAFGGQCEFCQNSIRRFPTAEEQKSQPPEELFCCEEYRDFVDFIQTHPLEKKVPDDVKIDIKPHPPYGSKQARKAARERASERMREREVQRQQAAIAVGASAGPHAATNAGDTSSFHQFARQMKTINYQLSSQKCLEEGWTLRPPSPLMDEGEMEAFELSPRLHADTKGRKVEMVLKYYKNGSKYIMLFPDGSGHVFYPSGRVALTITTSDDCLHSYIVQNDVEENNVLAVIEPNGRMVSYFSTGAIRVFLDRVGGVELTSGGAKKRKWTWREGAEHVHAPPIQPLTYSLNPHLAMRILSQDNMTLTFTAQKKTCRFQVGPQIKLAGVELPAVMEADKDEAFRRDCQTRIDCLLVKVNTLLRFPNSTRADHMSPPPHLLTKLHKVRGSRDDKTQKGNEKPARSSRILIVN